MTRVHVRFFMYIVRQLVSSIFREEQEKLNVWVAYLNLENMFGTDSSLQKLFSRAVQYNDPAKVYKQMIEIYSKSDKMKVICTYMY